MQLYADLEYIDGLLPVEVVVSDKSSQTPLEIMKPVLVVTAVTSLPSVPVTFMNHNLRLASLKSHSFQESQILLERQSRRSKQPHLS